MFEESLLESTPLLRTKNRWPAIASFALQATIAAVIVTIPLLHPEVAHLSTKLTELTAPVFKQPIPPPPPRIHVEPSTASSTSMPNTAPVEQALTRQPVLGAITHPLNPNASGDTPPAPGSGINMGPAGGNDPLAAMASTGTGTARVAVIPAKPGRVSLGVNPGILLAPIQPVYPPIARAARQEGTVIIHAIISKTGTIESANVVSGPSMLVGAALEAVRNAHYRPYRLNGDPTEVDTTFSIVFRLNS